ncbi:hypothetical protein [Lysinibacillus sp. RC79]|uniref:hypothetical protein n=1 Tax=Lysinibacillus sp. RC79 TaxID=3156296 RepID=UPI003510FDAC
MLTMIQAHHIKFLYEEKGYSLRKIANETGHDFKIVQKYVEQQDFNLKLEKRKTVSKKIDVYKDEIMDWLIADLEMPKKQRHTGKRVFDRLKEKWIYIKFLDTSRLSFLLGQHPEWIIPHPT